MAYDLSTFLTEGSQIPQGSALKALQSETILPEYYTDYAKQILANQAAISAQPYQKYQGPRVAAFTPDQQQSFEMTKQAAGAYEPQLKRATLATTNVMGKNALGTAQPYFTSAADMSGVGAATPGLTQGAEFTALSAQNLGQQAAQPYLGAAGQSTVANIGQYMNPYTEQVVNRIGELAGRNLSENIMPSIEGRYISAGQLGYGGREGGATPSGMMTDTSRAIRDIQEAALAEQSKALQAGYSEAGALSAADLARQAQLAQTAGALGTQQQGALAQAGATMADIGQTFGNLTAEQQQALINIGAQTGALSSSDLARKLEAAQQLAGMGEMSQALGLRGAGAVGQIGAQQQEQAQRNLDIAYENFLRQQGYNQEQVNNMINALKGTQGATPTATQEVGIAPTGDPAQYKPSTADSIAGALSGGAALLGEIGKLKL